MATQSENDELAERLLVLGNLQAATKVVEETNKREQTLLKMWKFMFEFVGILALIIALKIISFVSFWKAHYSGFIAFIEKYRNMRDSTGAVYSGPGGLQTALALESNILQLTFVNPYLPEALYYLYSTKSMREQLDRDGGRNILQNIYVLSLEGTPTQKQLNSVDLVCKGIQQQFPDYQTDQCGKVCTPALNKLTLGQRMVNNLAQSATNGAMAGHIIGTATSYGVAGGVGGLLVGAIAGVATSFLQQKQADDLCAQSESYCNDKC